MNIYFLEAISFFLLLNEIKPNIYACLIIPIVAYFIVEIKSSTKRVLIFFFNWCKLNWKWI